MKACIPLHSAQEAEISNSMEHNDFIASMIEIQMTAVLSNADSVIREPVDPCTTSLTITFLQTRYIKVHTATRWTIGHDLVLLCFKDLMNVTEKLQFIDQRFDTPVWCLHQESLKFVLPSSKKLSFNLSSPHPGQYTNCILSLGHPPFG